MSGDSNIYGGFVAGSGGSSETNWGEIRGTISNQKDLIETLESKVDKEENKGLSSNDFTDEEQEKLSKLNNIFEFSLSNDSWEFFNDNIYTHEDVGAVEANTKITGATKCKITYDSKGLVTAGEDLTSEDIPDISETYETKSNKSDSFTASSNTTYASTKALVYGLATKSEFKRYTATVGTSWKQGTDKEYSQEISNPD